MSASPSQITPQIAQTTTGQSTSNQLEVPGQIIGQKRPREHDILSAIPAKKATRTHPLVRVGRHFTRTVQAFCDIHELIREAMDRNAATKNGVPDDVVFGPEFNPDGTPNEDTRKTRREHEIYGQLLALMSTLEASLCNSSTPEDLAHVASLLTKGAQGARADDTKSLKTNVLDWITPRGVALTPPIPRNGKAERGFNHYWTGKLLCPALLDWEDEETRKSLAGGLTVPGDHWPMFVYRDYKFNPEDVWEGLFRSNILVSAFKHTFTSPSSVDQATKATRSCNAHLNGMKKVTRGSIAYIATQVRFALSSNTTLSKQEVATESETFYASIMNFFGLEEEQEDVEELLKWWNGQVFPRHHPEEAAAVRDISTIPQIPSIVMLAKNQREAKKRKALAEKTNQNSNRTTMAGTSGNNTSSAGGKEN
ncbi:hypothetical protein CC1G_12824 [Coprinopsis cinerea okayama7|uniref:Uncharacterized protein n=1 Tax=Coprinopsis cinerea (strain Okayama-7 / 130 / ATCC MYA-4618 / FGSC 9003) TaxID=240176 RepID=A8PD79_COPC7|nr:hypothetical protein CC1G_12824 [Coprinopsis cinerea okayama7\|eukprot:XP_001840551.1 hypothetical protein CC1G_12824 [Coprinopsis cinerea okayama7\